MIYRNLYRFLFAGILLVVLALLALATLQWLDIPTGRFIDWAVGVASFWWLTLIVTVPWNVYFQARQTLAEAAHSAERDIPVPQKRLDRVAVWARRALGLALGLHAFTALGLYALALTGISPVGYAGAGAALLLTALRPAVRGYEYLSQQLAALRREVKYPREDIRELRSRVDVLEKTLDRSEETSWASTVAHQGAERDTLLGRLRHEVDALRQTNERDHERFVREYRQALAQVTEDRRFLEHVREIVRFVKGA